MVDIDVDVHFAATVLGGAKDISTSLQEVLQRSLMAG